MGNTFRHIEINRQRRGHQFFSKEFLEGTPSFYSTEHVPFPNKVITAHFFTGNSDWYVAEFDPKNGEVFCFVVLNGDLTYAEWGYANLYELEGLDVSVNGQSVIVERDLDWVTTRFGDLKLAAE